MEETLTQTAGTCEKCGHETNDIVTVYDMAIDADLKVCPDCAEIIEAENNLYAKAAFVGCAVVLVMVLLFCLVAFIISVLC